MSAIAIVDFGSQVTQLIARRVRELGAYSEVFPPSTDFQAMIGRGAEISAFVLSGGPNSVQQLHEVPKAVSDVLELNLHKGIPVLGICYGLQVLAHYFGADVEQGVAREFGRAQLDVVGPSSITEGVWSVGSKADVWMSHSDSIVGEAPQGFRVVARSADTGAIALICNDERKIYGMQFHPEVAHTPGGREMLDNFLKVVGCARDWTMGSFLHTQIDAIRSATGGGRVVAAISGGVDSSVASVLVHRAIGEGLLCVFVDTGLLRKGEASAVRDLFVDKLKMHVNVLDKSDLFMRRLAGVQDPEAKRKIIGETFIEVFEQEARALGDIKFLMQGTIYPDVIESGTGGSGTKIKSHHNVGGLPEVMNLSLIEPLRCLFKDEVRLLGEELGLPSAILGRHPFPGPGLAVRIIGEVTAERVGLLREIDNIYINMMREAGLYGHIWQAFAVLVPVRTVGVMGDGRTYGYVCALRAVTSSDGMTADCFPFGEDDERKLEFLTFLQKVSRAIVSNLQGVNRVVYDITSKPPATIEWE
ncbi:bifunctional GMP synthase/glutamine amidotransferase [Anaplasma centrale str. Israel]|uniref:GMP synthase [glutamine-hydrolyzing] n=1 Tax=Anaplasma centrale (strain Israel) TaxID=574556 RepID=D1ATK6_ANACI|nr:glutamine-hydrolyzing GMP synthase [Anaplasma centrale]ACZ48884.1 bifunctional GMP synthase/glutamine amidotransferase [Anaplasma centrale str. Israel]